MCRADWCCAVTVLGQQCVRPARSVVAGVFVCILHALNWTACLRLLVHRNGLAGDNSNVTRTSPVAVSLLASPVLQVSTGESHTCVLQSPGAVYCFGSNGNGQLGTGSSTDSRTPVAVAGLSAGVTFISCGSYFTCALGPSNTVSCWGSK